MSRGAAAPLDLAGAIEFLVRRVVREELAAQRASDDTWVEVAAYLGCSRREAAERCRAGEFTGAVKVGKTWRAKRSAIDAAMERIGAARASTSNAAANDAGPEAPGDRMLSEILAAAADPTRRRGRGGARR